MKQKGVINVAIITLVIAVAGAVGYYAFVNKGDINIFRKASKPDNTNLPFQLNDPLAKYYLEKLGDRFVITYEKNGERPTSIYVSQDTTLPLENYLGKNLIINAEFTEETTQVQCVQAPCPPESSTVVRIKSITFK